jgi:hypothetical protein
MRYLAVLFLALIPCFATADDASHLAAAGKLIDLVKTRETMRNAYINSIDAVVRSAPPGQVTPAEINEMKQTTADWFDQELDWGVLKSKLEDVFVKSFTEDELNQLVAFYQTPLGQKTLTQLPIITQQALVVGRDYAQNKQSLWTARLQKVDEKYHPVPAAAAPTTTGGVLNMPSTPTK